ncbi:2-methyl-3-hydroxypyridine 5-carboxylic acid dioxygenase [Streptoalloteichus tenebrarius]|uniref:2-methyl-3-hydroxypyridine 5-carboxylic acid dioxygenase n=1 Tax=Streptoalloteichus tenebrarius (strain ATCC 17920 / DSM 40477 / JCM 4838 / CBS 697.72 / NBRC 16177 / NCIMB 11028 / NRRL B-12390 / A12253. 1 / ISP 5477) TaxID=1933 RepID=A0ABT1HLJ5_STRSD|nr:FAD-dependent monooxygenase [Streptoalloteichus tenebrarius]MCP2256386.1 2-methyl-3-hydroxypyridine 5-carboxylic acid dioxygenase [Streptoalloteichus tenebrarius]BFF04731.1 NAD(P)/FAD-dependent oxidoreductase [Streptoalloteichus tenebrarius]
MTRTAEVAGAGFAGLTVATELARRGWRVRVHEAGPRPRAFGAGIFLWTNGLRVLTELGVVEWVLARSYEASQWEERDSDDNELGIRPLPLPGGLRMVTMTRRTLHTALLTAAEAAGVEIRTGSRVVAAEPGGVLVTEDGARWPADLAVGADGIRSRVRDSLGLLAGHELFPYGMYRFLVPLARVPEFRGRWRNYLNFLDAGLRRRVLYVPCDERELYLLLGAVHTDEALRQPLDPAVWCETFPVLRPLLAELPPAPRYDRYEVLRLERWSVGRVAVVGDAAHAMPPTLGQGAGTAVMNALRLARAVADARDVPVALRNWESDNRPATELVQAESVIGVRELFPRDGERRDKWPEGAVHAAGRDLV